MANLLLFLVTLLKYCTLL